MLYLVWRLSVTLGFLGLCAQSDLVPCVFGSRCLSESLQCFSGPRRGGIPRISQKRFDRSFVARAWWSYSERRLSAEHGTRWLLGSAWRQAGRLVRFKGSIHALGRSLHTIWIYIKPVVILKTSCIHCRMGSLVKNAEQNTRLNFVVSRHKTYPAQRLQALQVMSRARRQCVMVASRVSGHTH